MKTPMYNQNKGYESNKQEAKNLISMNPLSKHMSTPMNMGGSKMKGSAMMMKGAMKGDQSKTRSDYAMDSGKTDKGYKGQTGSSKGDQSASKADYGSPAKNLGMKYDIKEASNQSLSAKARKHYAENAQAASKSGYKG
jgi:hypothetical protein